MDWWEDNKRTWRGRKVLFLQPWPWSPPFHFAACESRAFHLKRSTHFSPAGTYTISLSHFLPLRLSIQLSLSYNLANGKTVLGWILFFKGFNSPLYTLDLTLWQALSVSSAWYRGLVFCVLMDTGHYHTQLRGRSHAEKNAFFHMSMHARKLWLSDTPDICMRAHTAQMYAWKQPHTLSVWSVNWCAITAIEVQGEKTCYWLSSDWWI